VQDSGTKFSYDVTLKIFSGRLLCMGVAKK